MLRKSFVIYTKTFGGKICTEFPLATFSAKILTRLHKKISHQVDIKQHLMQKKIEN